MVKLWVSIRLSDYNLFQNHHLFEEVDSVSPNIRRQRGAWYVSACYVYFLFLYVFSVKFTTVLFCQSECCAFQRK